MLEHINVFCELWDIEEVNILIICFLYSYNQSSMQTIYSQIMKILTSSVAVYCTKILSYSVAKYL